MTVRAIDSLRRYFGTELPPVLWSPPDPRGAPATPAPPPVADDFDDDELTALQVLATPAVRIEARATGELTRKLCLARVGEHTARVVRTAGTVVVDLPYCDGSAHQLARLVAPHLGTAPAAPAAVAASFPARAGTAALTCGGDSGDIAAELRRIGVAAEPARLIARAVARSVRSCEFTLYSGAQRIDAVVAVIDGPDGRIVALTTAAETDDGWIAVAEGTEHRIGGALRRQCERLPGGGWMP